MEEALPDINQPGQPQDEKLPRTRPTGVSIIAILAMLFGSFNFCCTPISTGMMMFVDSPTYVQMRADSVIYPMTIGSTAVGWAMGLALLVLGIGLWKLKEWARAGMVNYAIFAIGWTIIAGIVNMIYVTPRAFEIGLNASPNKLPPGSLDNVRTGAMIGMYVGGALALMVMVGIYIFVAIYMRQPNVREAFRPDDSL